MDRPPLAIWHTARMIAAGFVVLSAAVLVWVSCSIPRAAMACGDAPSCGATRLRRRFLLAALAWVALAMALAWTGVLERRDVRPPAVHGLLVCPSWCWAR